MRGERALIERNTVDRPANEPKLQMAFNDKKIDIQETAEEAVVARNAKVIEEIQVGKTATDRTETERETLRQTELNIDIGDNMAGKEQGNSNADRHRTNDPKYSGEERRTAGLTNV